MVDHHVAEPKLPEAAAVVNPNRLDDDSGCGQLAAVGVGVGHGDVADAAVAVPGEYGGLHG